MCLGRLIDAMRSTISSLPRNLLLEVRAMNIDYAGTFYSIGRPRIDWTTVLPSSFSTEFVSISYQGMQLVHIDDVGSSNYRAFYFSSGTITDWSSEIVRQGAVVTVYVNAYRKYYL